MIKTNLKKQHIKQFQKDTFLSLGIGGLSKGRVIEIYGPDASGLALQVIAEAQKAGDICGFIDCEHTLDQVYAKKLGVSTEELLISQPDIGEEAFEIANTLIKSGTISVLVIDSVSALTPRAEIEGDVGGDLHAGLQSRSMSQALKKLTSSISKTNIMVIYINQTKMKIGAMFESPKTTSGKNVPKFYNDESIEIKLMQYADGVLPMGPGTKSTIKNILLRFPKYKKIVSAMKLSKNIMNKYNKTLKNHPLNQKIPKYLKETIKKLKKSERKIFFDRITRDKDTGLTDAQKKEIDETFIGQDIANAFPIFKKYINNKYLLSKLNLEMRNTLKTFSKGKDTKLSEVGKLINKYGFTRLIQMFLRDYGFDFLFENKIKTHMKIKKKIKN